MVKEGVLEGPDAPEAILALHVWPNTGGTLAYRSGSFLAAADGLRIKVVGRQTHGSSPWLGVDPTMSPPTSWSLCRGSRAATWTSPRVPR